MHPIPVMCSSSRQTAGRSDAEGESAKAAALYWVTCVWVVRYKPTGLFLPPLWPWLNTLTCSNTGQLEFMMVNLLFGEHTRAIEEVKAPGTVDTHQDICRPAHTVTVSLNGFAHQISCALFFLSAPLKELISFHIHSISLALVCIEWSLNVSVYLTPIFCSQNHPTPFWTEGKLISCAFARTNGERRLHTRDWNHL